MSEEQLWSIPDDVESIYIHYTTEDLLKCFREEALRHREEIKKLHSIIKEVREYVIQEVNNIKAITYINILDLLDKENK